jgi:hypothetical protein
MAAAAALSAASAQAQTPAAERMNAPGPEQEALAARAGVWEVTSTIWPAPGAPPIVTRGLIAERTMIGPFLQEVMHPPAGAAGPDFKRLDYVGYSRVEGRWQYVSMDTRLPVGLMPAWSYDRGVADRITLTFEPIAFVGFGPEVEGRMVRSDMTITRDGPDHELKQQHFVFADGKGQPYLAVQYEYRRKR